jgi:hypothetical protein
MADETLHMKAILDTAIDHSSLSTMFGQYEGMFKDLSNVFVGDTSAGLSSMASSMDIGSVGTEEEGQLSEMMDSLGSMAPEGEAASAAGAVAPELLAPLIAMAAALMIIQKLIEFLVGTIQKVVDALLGPIFDALSSMLSIMLVPFKVLGVFLMTLIIPFFQIATRLSNVLLTFFMQFESDYDTYLQAAMTGGNQAEGIPNEESDPMAAELAAGADALTDMFGGIIVAIQTGIGDIMITLATDLVVGFATIINALPIVGGSLTGFIEATQTAGTTLIAANNASAAASMQIVDAIGVQVGNVTYTIADTANTLLNRLIKSQTSSQDAANQAVIDAGKTVVIASQQLTPPATQAATSLTTTGTSATDAGSAMDALTLSINGNNLPGVLAMLAFNAGNASNAINDLQQAASSLYTTLSNQSGSSGSGSGSNAENYTLTFLGINTGLALRSGPQSINLGAGPSK